MRPIYMIAQDIRKDWHKPYFGAVPYLNAMRDITEITDNYGHDTAHSVIAYFLSNASTWRGPKAKEVKAELKALMQKSLKRNYKKYLEYNGFAKNTSTNPIKEVKP